MYEKQKRYAIFSNLCYRLNLFSIEFNSTLLRQLRGKSLYYSDYEKNLKLKELKEPLLENSRLKQLTEESELTQKPLKGLIIYIIDKKNKIRCCGLLANENEIIVPFSCAFPNKNYVLKVQNINSSSGESDYGYRAVQTVPPKGIISAQVSASAQISPYFKGMDQLDHVT